MALCGMKCVDLRLSTVKILGLHFSHNKKIENDENFLKQITSIEEVLKLWCMRNLILEGKVTAFKALAISKIVHLALITNIRTSTMKELNKIQKKFIWKSKKLKITHTTLCNNYDNGNLKNVDISSKIISLQCSYPTLLYNTTPSWKFIPLILIKTNLRINFKFNSNLDISVQKLKKLDFLLTFLLILKN